MSVLYEKLRARSVSMKLNQMPEQALAGFMEMVISAVGWIRYRPPSRMLRTEQYDASPMGPAVLVRQNRT